MIFKKVIIQNFFSMGNVPQEVDLRSTGLTLILGENLDNIDGNSRNGTGKSTILNAISFALFGQGIGQVKKDNFVNLTNKKNMIVELHFQVGNVEYKICRGRKPAVLKYYINQIEQQADDESQGDSRQTQEEIVKTIGMSYELFKQIVLMSTFVEPFPSMRAMDQRNLVEELLSMNVITQKAEKLKDLIKDTKDIIKEQEYELKTLRDNNNRVQQLISQGISDSERWEKTHLEKTKFYCDRIEFLEKINIEEELKNHENLLVFNEIENEKEKLTKQLMKLDNDNHRVINEIEELENKNSILKSHVCPLCSQHLEDNNLLVSENDQNILQLKKSIEEIENSMSKLLNEVDELETIQKTIDIKLVIYQTIKQAEDHKNEFANIVNSLEEHVKLINPHIEQIERLQNQALMTIDESSLNSAQVLLKHQDLIFKMLTQKDSFIRKKIIDQNISYLNHRLQFYTEKLLLPHCVEFQNDLSLEITLYGHDYDYSQLSRGEQNRVNLSLAWSFRDVWESLNQPINLLFCDEILDNGMDQQGAESALQILNQMHRENGKNIILSSHKEDLVGRVTNRIIVRKQEGFSTIYYE
jgi:DNA repair exonuclease SbcCD ATPase subunit